MSPGLSATSCKRHAVVILRCSCLLFLLMGSAFQQVPDNPRYRLAQIRGQILPAEGEFQLPQRVTVTLSLRERSLSYSQDGQSGLYRFPDLGNGRYKLEVSAPGYETVTETVNVEGSLRGQVVIVNLQLGEPLEEGPYRPTAGAGQTVSSEQLQLPKQIRKLLERASTAADQGEHREAAKLYERVVKQRPDLSKAWNNLAVQYLKDGRVDDAKSALSRALEVSPNDVSANRNLALLQVSLEEYRSALVSLQRLFQLLPEDMTIRALLAECYLQTGYYELALKHFQKVAGEEAENSEWLLKISDCQARLGRLQEAIRSLENFLSQNPQGDRNGMVRSQIERLRNLISQDG